LKNLSESANGLLIVGHGTRHAGGRAEFLATVAQVSQRLPGVAVQPCFLELAKPTIAAGAEQLARRGARHVAVVPLMLLAAAHVKRDVPAAVAAAAAELAPRYGPIRFRPTAHLGLQAELITLSAQRFRQCVEHSVAKADKANTDGETMLLIAGRGSRDPLAADELRRFVQLRCQQTPVAGARACFMAMAEPSLQAALNESARAGWRRVVVQPHLLFRGQVLAQLDQLVRQSQVGCPDGQWLVTRHIGPDPLLADLIVRLAQS
jgi:sirohydrochlorin cobaltochelatase